MRVLIYAAFILPLWSANALAGDLGKTAENISWNLFFIVLSGIIGYIVGTVKSFREEKQKAYGEIIPPILKMAYNPQDVKDEVEYCKALTRLWLYGSKEVIERMEYALKIIHNPSTGNVTKALQETVAEMRRDIQIFSWQKIRAEDVNHLYTRIVGMKTSNDKDKT